MAFAESSREAFPAGIYRLQVTAFETLFSWARN
jgi:hypothetical protein